MGLALDKEWSGVGPFAESDKQAMNLKLTDKCVVLLVLRQEKKGDCYQVQGIAIADTAPEAEAKARAICRNESYFWVGPLPPNAAFPHSAFSLPKHFPIKKGQKRGAKK